jgi:LysR family transcriptional regulator, carnitine catabolism transcriptional activator
MEVAQLRYAVAVADCGSFTAAAQQCFVSQPSLSQAIKAIERQLGVELFTRSGRPVRLTAAGEAFVRSARVALRAFDSISNEVALVVGLMAGHLDLVALPTLALDPVAAMVGAFRTRHPGVVVRLAHPDGTDDLLRLVRAGDSEVGITESPPAGVSIDGLTVRSLGRQELVVVLPPDSEVGQTISADELADIAIVAQPKGTSTRSLLDGVLAAVGRSPHVVVETDQRDAVVPLVLAGAGVALLPLPMAQHAAARGARTARLSGGLTRELAIVHRAADLSPAAAVANSTNAAAALAAAADQ